MRRRKPQRRLRGVSLGRDQLRDSVAETRMADGRRLQAKLRARLGGSGEPMCLTPDLNGLLERRLFKAFELKLYIASRVRGDDSDAEVYMSQLIC